MAEPPEFHASLNLWSHYDLGAPFAIVQPANENDIVLAVREAVAASHPSQHQSMVFHQPEGVIVDLSLYRGTTGDAAKSLCGD
ncbi:uncharacterized protein GGS25DRAFT_492411, partial [Hypoxylon fragiforme]|uniref:uncharacterized protein n=1 Tax=Hypoxylon fragiforme TaxID=63214 RepID=UPI0020C70D26